MLSPKTLNNERKTDFFYKFALYDASKTANSFPRSLTLQYPVGFTRFEFLKGGRNVGLFYCTCFLLVQAEKNSARATSTN